MLVAARAAGPAGIGLWSMALAFQGYALQLGELGLRSAVTAEAIRTRGGARALIGRYLVLRLGISATTIAASLAFVAFWRPDHLALMALTLASLIPIACQLDWVPLVEGRALAAVVPLAARPAAFLLLLLAWPGALTPEAIALAFLLAWCVAAALSLPPLRHPVRVAGQAPPPEPARLLRQGLGFAAVTLASQLLLSADLLAVGFGVGIEAAGNYYLASAIAVAGTVLANAAGQMALARLGRSRGDAPAVRREAARICRAGIAAGLPVAALMPAAAWLLLPFMLGDEFGPAMPVLCALAPWVVLSHLTTPLQALLGAAGRQPAALRANIAAVAALLPLLAAAAWFGGIWAFAAARTAAELVRLVLLAHAAGLTSPFIAGNAGGKPRDVRFYGAR